jgi:hypothetical protein
MRGDVTLMLVDGREVDVHANITEHIGPKSIPVRQGTDVDWFELLGQQVQVRTPDGDVCDLLVTAIGDGYGTVTGGTHSE